MITCLNTNMDTTILLGTLFVLVCIYFMFFEWKKNDRIGSSKNSDNGIPGPGPSHPKLGNFPDIAEAGSLHQYLKRMHALYGHVVQIWYGKRPVVSTASPEAFKVQAKIFTKPGMDFIAPLFGAQGIQFVNGEDAKHRMNTFNYFLRKDAIEEYCPIFEKVVQNLISKWDALPEGTTVAIKENMYYLSSKVIGIAVCGEYFEKDENVEQLRSLYTKAWPILEANFAEGLPREGTQERRDFDKDVSDIHDIVREMVRSRSKRSDLRLIDVVTEMHDDVVTRHGDILAYILGGFHNTSITMTWCLYYSAKYPDLQEKIYKEIIDEAQDGDVTAEITHKLRYLRQFINETLRLRFIASVAIRETERDTEVHGHKLPQGTFLVQALSVVLTDDKIWPEPERFDPERFSPENSKNRPPLAFSPFGFAGKRLCPGREFFYRESMVQLACLFRRYKFQLVDTEEPEVTYGLLTRPTDEVYLYISKRQ